MATMAWACTKSSGSSGTGTVVVPPVSDSGTISWWLTRGDQSALLQKQSTLLSFGTTSNGFPNIDIDTSVTYQSIDGFGFALTGGSAKAINGLNAADKASLLQELFGNGANSIGISYLRISIGASDLNDSVFSYDDIPAGQTDTGLVHFSLGPDQTTLVPLLQQILQINPSIRIIATPWSAPVWMKDNSSTVGGSLLPQYYGVYANYFVKYLEQMKAAGISIDAVTPQN
ncbi:MAG: glucosylceramidase, partial [Bacteroidota bacterium]|nr:glucosylceramidase [Bacteroidota bacterium]